MKKEHVLLPLLLLVASCDDNLPSLNSESVSASNTVSESSSSSVDENEVNILNELELIKNQANPTSIKILLNAKKDGKMYLNYVERNEYDKNNGFLYHYHSLQRNAGLENNANSYNEEVTVYYDGESSYTLNTDEWYYKKAEVKEIKPLKIGLNFNLVESLSFEKVGFENVLNGVIPSASANEFLNTQGKQYSDITFKSATNTGNLVSVSLSYTLDGFNVNKTISFGFVDLVLTLPTNVIKEK